MTAEDSEDLVYEPYEGNYPIYFMQGVPREILDQYLAIRRKFGPEIADVVVEVFKREGASVARTVAKRMLEADSFEELIASVMKKIDVLAPGAREAIANIVYSYQYSYYLRWLLRTLDAEGCVEGREPALAVFRELAKAGIFFSPDCFVKVFCLGEYSAKCYNFCRATVEFAREKAPSVCRVQFL